MNLNDYVLRVVKTRKSVFCKIEIDETFNSATLAALCDLKIKRERLNVAWAVIIDVLNEKFFDEAINYLTSSILEFLIDNEIELVGLGHLRLPNKYLKTIYEKDNRCWEALKNMSND